MADQVMKYQAPAVLSQYKSIVPAPWLQNRGAFEHGADDSKVLMLRVFGQWLNLDPRDTSLTPCLLRDGYWEAWVSLAVARAVKPGYVCVDAGAHVGYYTALFQALGAKYVMSIEPNEAIANRLYYAMAVNNWKNMELKRVALWREDGEITLNEFGSLTGSTSFLDVPGYDATNKIKVRAAPLDNIVKNLDSVDFIKIDIEGGEVEAWEGMQETMKKFSPIVAMEIAKTPPRGYDVQDFVEKIRKSDTKVEMISYDGDIVPYSYDFIDKEGWAMLWLTR